MPDQAIAKILAGIAEHYEVIAGVIGGRLAYLSEVKNGTQKRDSCVVMQAFASAGFFAFVTCMICVESFTWSSCLRVVASGGIA